MKTAEDFLLLGWQIPEVVTFFPLLKLFSYQDIYFSTILYSSFFPKLRECVKTGIFLKCDISDAAAAGPIFGFVFEQFYFEVKLFKYKTHLLISGY